MKKTKFYQRTIKIITSITLIGIFFGGWNFAQIINEGTLVDGIDLIDKTNTDRDNFNKMIKSFCTSLGSDDYYDSSQSLFVYYVCKKQPNPDKIDTYKLAPTFDQKKGFSEDPKTSYTNFIEDDEGNKLNELDLNLPGIYYDTEDYIQILFDSIIGSYTSIYQANIYGYTNDPSKSIEDNIHENFAKKYFKINSNEHIKFCATDEDYKYPKTCKKLKEYFYGARNLINSNTENYLNDQNIYKNIPIENKENACMTKYGENIIPCGLYGGEIKYFINLVYNELMFYALFVDYYSYLLQNKSDFKNFDVTEFQRKLANNQKRIQTMLNNIETSRTATQTTIKMLKELQYTFPIHIGFLMYSEAIYSFTSSMNKTLTPIYTLQDILRNVQKTD